jgi:hypothetical protein
VAIKIGRTQAGPEIALRKRFLLVSEKMRKKLFKITCKTTYLQFSVLYDESLEDLAYEQFIN